MTVIDRPPVNTEPLVRPQPLGVFDGPAGLVLLAGPDVGALLTDVAAGAVPDHWPAAAAVLAAAIAGDIDGALAALGDSAVDRVNRFVLRPTRATLADARAAAGDDRQLGAVLDTAAFASGHADTPPGVDGLDGEFAVLALTARASAALEDGDRAAALGTLGAAIEHATTVGPALQARVVGTLAEHLYEMTGPSDEVLARYDEAIALLARTGHDVVRAGLQMQRGAVTHQLADGERHRLVDAVRSYQSALMVLNEEHHAESFAFANMNLALAILAMPMTQASDQVRLGVAVQSLRAALRVYRPQTHPHEWASGQLNLANALQYLPSRHREENLAEAVELLEEVLAARSPQRDPAGYARVLANQANALAHLGIFDHATAKYAEAADWFDRAGDREAVAAVQGQLHHVAEQRLTRTGGTGGDA